jgi:hypothetical protein
MRVQQGNSFLNEIPDDVAQLGVDE